MVQVKNVTPILFGVQMILTTPWSYVTSKKPKLFVLYWLSEYQTKSSDHLFSIQMNPKFMVDIQDPTVLRKKVPMQDIFLVMYSGDLKSNPSEIWKPRIFENWILNDLILEGSGESYSLDHLKQDHLTKSECFCLDFQFF